MDERQESATMEERANEKKSRWNIGPYIAIGLTAFIVIVASMGVFFLMFRFKGIFSGLDMLLASLQSVIIGFVIAYLASPIVNFFERHILNALSKRMENEQKRNKTARSLSILAALAVVIAIICLLLGILIPTLIDSIISVVITLPDKISHFMDWLEQMDKNDSEIGRQISRLVDQMVAYITKFLNEDLPEKMKSAIFQITTQVTTGVISVGKFLLNIVVGFIVSVYVLFDKEKFIAQSKKIVYAVTKPKVANEILKTVRKSHEIFIGFIVGKIIDSIIIGFLTYILLRIFGLPYTLLISVIVGVTNVIPFFGPFIGAIPCAILLLLDNPIEGLYFIILILVIQQLDGNIIGPKILGNSIGLSSFWVIVAILISGGLFGIPGMLLGVPVFAVVYYLFTQLIHYILKKKQYPLKTSDYEDVAYYDLEQEVFIKEDRTQKKSVVPNVKLLKKMSELLKKDKSEDE